MTKTAKFSGVLPVIKPAGPTSHDLVQVARHALKERQIGHTGTLDPAASGVVVLCIGPYTKLVPYLVASDKSYRGHLGFGLETSTDDGEGVPLTVYGADGITLKRVQAEAAKYVGDIQQLPPRYAAVKVAGKKLYEYARAGQEVEVAARPVTVRSFEVPSIEEFSPSADLLAKATPPPPEEFKYIKAEFTARVSAGTYVRSLARDLGRDLNCGGFLLQLWRDSVGKFTEKDAMTLEELKEHPESAEEYVFRGASALDNTRYPVLTLLKPYEERLSRGQPLLDKMMEPPGSADALESGTVCGIASEDGRLLAVMQAERFQDQVKQNVYGSRFGVHFKPLRIFAGGLK